MDSSAIKPLSEIVEEIIRWSRKPDLFLYKVKVSWRESHLKAVLHYVNTLGVDSDFSLLIYTKLCVNEIWNRRFEAHNYQKFAEMVVSFTQDLQELFKVPKLSPDLNQNELVALFISFLLQLLDQETYLVLLDEEQVATLLKELRYLITILGDTPFQAIDDELNEGIKILLAEFEGVANEAGDLVHSLIFAVNDEVFNTMDESIGVLLKNIEILKANIIKSSKLLTSKALSHGESLFIVDSLLYDLQDLVNRDDDRTNDVNFQISVLHQKVTRSMSLLRDMMSPQNSESETQRLKEPVMRITDIAHEAQYLINSFLVGDSPLWYLTIRLDDIIHKIELISHVLQEIKDDIVQEITDNFGALQVAENLSGQESLQDKKKVEMDEITVGFDDKVIDILDKLVGGTEQRQIISIFGMPGLGKTTLAKKLYYHLSVNDRFDLRSWCVVSQTYNRKNLLIDLSMSLTSMSDREKYLGMDEGSLALYIYKSLMGRRYLIVMDDIWDLNVWYDFCHCFPDNENGSRILFTSRIKDVTPPGSITYPLRHLSNDQCWELLKKKVFKNESCPPDLAQIGDEIAANCGGLPLAVVVVAGILSTMDKKESTWEDVKRSLVSHIFSDQNNPTMQILKLSYKHLPEHLKPCFLYLGAFPEDTEIPVQKLKWLWIAEGFICQENNKSAEHEAEKYLMDLINKSLVIVAKRKSDGGLKACVVHDLLRDLCLRIAGEGNFLKLLNKNYSVSTKHQRLCVHSNPTSKISPQFLLPFELHVRSFLGSGLDSSLYVLSMKLLRVLDLPNNTLSHGDKNELLIHLRYLAVNCMPASIGSLVNLEFLIVNAIARELVSLSVIQKLVKLKYLSVPQGVFDRDFNSTQTNALEYLSSVLINKQKDEDMLKCSPNLRKLKCVCRPLSEGKGSYRYPDLRFLNQLESLNMTTFHGRENAKINIPYNIKKLSLSGLRLPWGEMTIIGSLPNLQVLKLATDAFVGEIWETIEGEFLQLKFLKLDSLNFVQWKSSREAFPRLQRLVLRDCHHLQGIPLDIGDIGTLDLIEVLMCSVGVAESVEEIQREQLMEMGNEELRVVIGDIHRFDG